MIGLDPSIADALAAAVAEALSAAAHRGAAVHDHVVVTDGTWGAWYLYRVEPDGEIAQGQDASRALRLTRPSAERTARALGQSWRAHRIT